METNPNEYTLSEVKCYTCEKRLNCENFKYFNSSKFKNEKNDGYFINLFNSGPIGICISGGDKSIIEVNHELCKMLGYERHELLGKSWTEFVHSNEIGKSLDLFTHALDGDYSSYNFEQKYVRKNGSILHALSSVILLRNDDNSISQIIASIIDTSVQFDLQECRKKDYYLLRTLMDNLPFNVYATDREGRKTISNKADFESAGVDSEDKVLGKTMKEIYPGEFGENIHAENISIIKSGKPLHNKELQIHDNEGQFRSLLASKIPIIDTNQEISGLIAINQDITPNKEIERKLFESEFYYKTLIEISPNGIVIADKDGVPTYISKKVYEIFGLPADIEVRKLWIFDFVVDRHTVIENFKKSMSGTQDIVKWEYKCLKYNKEEFWGELCTSPVKDNFGKIVGIMVSCQDITERKVTEAELITAKEKAQQSDKLKTAILNNMSHEIRTPLNAILGFSELLCEPGITDDTKASYVEIIQTSSDHLITTIDDLIEISKIQASAVEIKRSEVNINELLCGIHKRFRLKAAEKRIKLTISEGIPDNCIIRADQSRLIKILSNLVDNSVKFSITGEIIAGYIIEDSQIEFFVSDTGVGISPEFHSRVFDPFFQVDNSLHRNYNGNGLGLAICKAYVNLLGGKIWLDSEIGKGSRFRFTIPFDPVNGEKVPGIRKNFPEDFTVLVVDDLVSNLWYLKDLLTRQNIRVLTAENGVEALEKCQNTNKIDLILMDLKMPVMDGYESAVHIKKLKPGIPLIAQSAYVNEKDMALKSGFDDFIYKPFTPHNLLSIIKKHIAY